MTADGLPIAYTQEELYDKVIFLKTQIKQDKGQLVELETLFSYVRKMMDSVAETAFLVGAEFASLEASTRLATAESQVVSSYCIVMFVAWLTAVKVRQELYNVSKAETDLLNVEKDSIDKWSKDKKKLDSEEKRMMEEKSKMKSTYCEWPERERSFSERWSCQWTSKGQ